MPSFRAELFAYLQHSILVALTLAVGSAHAETRPSAVVIFVGPQATVAEATAVRAMRHRVNIIPRSKWSAAAKKLFASSSSPDDVSAIAEDIGANYVVLGATRREGKQWSLLVSLRDGKSGRSRDKFRYPLKGPRLDPKTLNRLGDDLSNAVNRAANTPDPAESKTPVRETRSQTQAPPPAREPPPARTSNDTRQQPPEREPDDLSARPAWAESNPPPTRSRSSRRSREAAAEEEAAAKPVVKRPRWAPYFDIALGISLSGRSFDFLPSSLPRFGSGVVPGLRLDASIYPLAFTHAKAAGVFTGLGVFVQFDKPFWPATRTPDGNQYATDELRFEGGLKWKFVLYKPIPRPELYILAGGGAHNFSIAKRLDPDTNVLVDVGPPDFSYGYATLAAGFRLSVTEWAQLWTQFNYHIVFAAGQATTGSEYGPATAFGLRIQGGADFFVYRGLKLGVQGFYERFQLSFVNGNPPPAKAGAARSVDQYFGGVFTVGYVF